MGKPRKNKWVMPPLYDRWLQMRARCRYRNRVGFANYGGRGIKVCERWHKFANFIEDMGLPPFPGATIDRIDNDGDYSPENCRWATRAEQAKNRRDTIMITINNCRLCLYDWSKWVCTPLSTIKYRKYKKGWSWPDSILTPVGGRGVFNKKRISDRGISWDEGTDY